MCFPLWWRHNDYDSVSNHQPHDCLLNRLFRRRSKKTSKLRVNGLCVGNSPGPVNSPHKGPVTWKMFPFDDVIMRFSGWMLVIVFGNGAYPTRTMWHVRKKRSISIPKHTTNCINTLRPRQNGRHFADDIFKRIFLNENVWIPIKISLKFVPKGPISNIPAMVQIMAWRRPGDKPLSEPMIARLPTHICVTRPQWVKSNVPFT